MKRFIATLAILASAGAGGALIAVTQPAVAAPAAKIVANGSLSCPTLKGTITFSPPLTETGSSTGSIKYNPHKCTTTATNLPAGIIIGGGDGVVVLNYSLAHGAQWGIMPNWWTGGSLAIADSKVTIASGTFSTTKGKDEGMVLQGTAENSFAGPVQVTLNSSTTTAAFNKELETSGVSSLKITSGTATLGSS
ncbi:MAG TPA: hypothetical protein VHY58_01050 [Streptosporangiaceae bacterium]|jgi:hypothetical protein|nr:hypothetical protein [Streptosporangiaceae bacterium]